MSLQIGTSICLTPFGALIPLIVAVILFPDTLASTALAVIGSMVTVILQVLVRLFDVFAVTTAFPILIPFTLPLPSTVTMLVSLELHVMVLSVTLTGVSVAMIFSFAPTIILAAILFKVIF